MVILNGECHKKTEPSMTNWCESNDRVIVKHFPNEFISHRHVMTKACWIIKILIYNCLFMVLQKNASIVFQQKLILPTHSMVITFCLFSIPCSNRQKQLIAQFGQWFSSFMRMFVNMRSLSFCSLKTESHILHITQFSAPSTHFNERVFVGLFTILINHQPSISHIVCRRNISWQLHGTKTYVQ